MRTLNPLSRGNTGHFPLCVCSEFFSFFYNKCEFL